MSEDRHRQLRGERLLWLHRYTISMSSLPEDFERRINADPLLKSIKDGVKGALALYFFTATNWQDWYHSNQKHVGMHQLANRIDQEHYCPEAPDSQIDYTMPTVSESDGADWRLGSLDVFHGFTGVTDEEPLDVMWTRHDLDQLEQYFKEWE